MHRSGTSCLTGIMQRFGVQLGDVFEANPFNKRGNRENAEIMALNDEVLKFNGGAWDEPVIIKRWSQEQIAKREAITDAISSLGHPYWGFKDPRMLLTYPFWLKSIKDPLFIATFRHPVRVALSLNQRNPAMNVSTGLKLWLMYNKNLIRLIRKYDVPVVDFDKDPEDYLSDVITGLTGLGLDSRFSKDAIGFFTNSLRNQTKFEVSDEDLPEEVKEIYMKLKKLQCRKL